MVIKLCNNSDEPFQFPGAGRDHPGSRRTKLVSHKLRGFGNYVTRTARQSASHMGVNCNWIMMGHINRLSSPIPTPFIIVGRRQLDGGAQECDALQPGNKPTSALSSSFP